MSNTIDKYILITFSEVNNPYPCNPYMFITENYSSDLTIVSFWAPALKSPAENGIPKKISGYVTANIFLLYCFISLKERTFGKSFMYSKALFIFKLLTL